MVYRSKTIYKYKNACMYMYILSDLGVVLQVYVWGEIYVLSGYYANQDKHCKYGGNGMGR